MRLAAFVILAGLCALTFAQPSIHQLESEKYRLIGQSSVHEYDAMHSFVLMDKMPETSQLEKIVFGYHPYWGGSNYLNYQWNLLSDLCYFSYEVDPATGGPDTYHDWLNSPAIDSAYANGTRVHLCVTLFSDHSTFFENPAARENLTNNLISLVKLRNAHGVSFDFELVPSSQGENMVEYVGEFESVFRDSIPDGMISIAIPAVDWSGIFNISELNNHIDLYMIMGYDYYWNGSNMAGPVDPHYSMTYGYNYSVSRTISYYQSEGMPLDRMLIGVPYYAREWPTESGEAPSNATGYGDAYTWAKIRTNSSGNYSPDNKKWEPNAFAPYYAYEDGGWYQCFVNDTYSLERRYGMVTNRGLAGIGIWALGYDNGYTDLWEVIQQNLAQGTPVTWGEEIFDSGGPSWGYYDNEDYVLTYYGEQYESMRLEFNELELETGYDSLWIYDGIYPGADLLGAYTGNELPPVFYAMNADNAMSIRFKSDHSTRASGWKAVIENYPIGIAEAEEKIDLNVYPNPCSGALHLRYSIPRLRSGQVPDTHVIPSGAEGRYPILEFFQKDGKKVKMIYPGRQDKGSHELIIDMTELPNGIYFLKLKTGGTSTVKKIIKQ